MKKIHQYKKKFDSDTLGQAGLQAFFNITKLWNLESDEEIILLGNPPKSTFLKWKKEKKGHLSPDTLERISYILGIYKALRILLPTEKSAYDWLKKKNSAPMFNGSTALEKMLGGNVIHLADIHCFLNIEKEW